MCPAFAQDTLLVQRQDSLFQHHQDTVHIHLQDTIYINDTIYVNNPPEVVNIFTHPHLRHATIACIVTDGDSIYEERNADLLVHPASLLKLITTATALRKLGPDYKISRREHLTDSVFKHKDVFRGYNPEWLIEDVDRETFVPLSEVPMPGKRLSFVISETNKNSLNEPAEMMACLLAPSRRIVDGLDSIRSYWRTQGLELDTCSILYDGNGLSPNDCVTARLLSNILLHMRDDEVYRNSLPVAGVEGTLGRFLNRTKVAGHARLKSGTLKSTVAYAGYLTTRSGKELVTVLIVNNYLGKRKEIRKLIEPWFISIYEKN